MERRKRRGRDVLRSKEERWEQGGVRRSRGEQGGAGRSREEEQGGEERGRIFIFLL